MTETPKSAHIRESRTANAPPRPRFPGIYDGVIGYLRLRAGNIKVLRC